MRPYCLGRRAPGAQAAEVDAEEAKRQLGFLVQRTSAVQRTLAVSGSLSGLARNFGNRLALKSPATSRRLTTRTLRGLCLSSGDERSRRTSWGPMPLLDRLVFRRPHGSVDLARMVAARMGCLLIELKQRPGWRSGRSSLWSCEMIAERLSS